MLTNNNDDSTDALLSAIHLHRTADSDVHDGARKIEQIRHFVSVMDADVRRMTRKRKLVFVESAAGNCYLSFLVYNYFANDHGRDIEIHCVDRNIRLMQNARDLAGDLKFQGMYFHGCDILEFDGAPTADISYSLHACDSATDKALCLGIRLNASKIYSVACCQHEIAKKFRNAGLSGVTTYKAYRERLLYMVADSMRAHLVAMHGYQVDIFDFVSTRFTDKNTMLRARKSAQQNDLRLSTEYDNLRRRFNIEPSLKNLL